VQSKADRFPPFSCKGWAPGFSFSYGAAKSRKTANLRGVTGWQAGGRRFLFPLRLYLLYFDMRSAWAHARCRVRTNQIKSNQISEKQARTPPHVVPETHILPKGVRRSGPNVLPPIWVPLQVERGAIHLDLTFVPPTIKLPLTTTIPLCNLYFSSCTF
jgi:hypothetical protein